MSWFIRGLYVFQIFLISAFVPLALGAANRDGTDVPQPSDISRQIRTDRKQVESLSLKYRLSADHEADPDTMRTWINKEFVRRGEETFAFMGKDEKRFLQTQSEHMRRRVQKIAGEPNKEILSATPATEVRAFDGNRLVMRMSDSVGAIYPKNVRDRVPATRFESWYLTNIGWFVEDPTASLSDEYESNRQQMGIPELLDTQACSAEVVEESGLRCVKLENVSTTGVRDALWLSVDHGFALIRRESSDVASNVVTLKTVNSGLVEIVKGVWVPQTVVVSEYAPPQAPTELRGGLLAATRMELLDWKVNSVDDSMFVVELPANALISDYEAAEKDNPSATEPFVRFTSLDGQLIDRTLKQITEERSGKLRALLLYGNGAFVLALIAVFAVRKFRRSSGQDRKSA